MNRLTAVVLPNRTNKVDSEVLTVNEDKITVGQLLSELGVRNPPRFMAPEHGENTIDKPYFETINIHKRTLVSCVFFYDEDQYGRKTSSAIVFFVDDIPSEETKSMGFFNHDERITILKNINEYVVEYNNKNIKQRNKYIFLWVCFFFFILLVFLLIRDEFISWAQLRFHLGK